MGENSRCCDGQQAAAQGKQQSLGGQQPHQLRPCCAECGAKSDFARAAHGARQHESGEVEAGHQQHRKHSAHHCEQAAAHPAHNRILQRPGVEFIRGVMR